jgi:hypothetical protein
VQDLDDQCVEKKDNSTRRIIEDDGIVREKLFKTKAANKRAVENAKKS